MGKRPHTDHGVGGYSHSDDHCDLCAAQTAWACRELERGEYDERLRRLEKARDESVIKNTMKDERARFWLKVLGGVATTGVAPWVVIALSKLLELLKGG